MRRPVLALALALLGGGGLVLACGGASTPEACAEACDGDPGAADGGPSGMPAPPDVSDAGPHDATAAARCGAGGRPGMLDPTFGNGGFVHVNANPGGSSEAHSVIIQPDGKTVLAGGLTGPGLTRLGLVRLTETGALDTGFGDGGIVDTSFPSGTSWANSAVALAADGRILVGGTTGPNGAYDFAIVRYSPGGVSTPPSATEASRWRSTRPTTATSPPSPSCPTDTSSWPAPRDPTGPG